MNTADQATLLRVAMGATEAPDDVPRYVTVIVRPVVVVDR
jgi:hypothetical protein